MVPSRNEQEDEQEVSLAEPGTTHTTGTTENDHVRASPDDCLGAEAGPRQCLATVSTTAAAVPTFYRRVLTALHERCPELVDPGSWQQAIEDSRRFLAQWGEQAEALGWTARDLFGLPPAPDKPHPNYRRLSRYDETG